MSKLGTLFIVATPIGNLDDISKRAVAVLQSVHTIAAEDTRHSNKLLQSVQVKTRLVSHHDFSSDQATRKLIDRLLAGDSIALISDAGTPLISDPGSKLVILARTHGIPVIPIPGASAVTAALSVAGLPTDKFVFEGFLPGKSAARQHRLDELVLEPRTLVFYESPHRIVQSLKDMQLAFGDDREIFIARELTKKFESHFLGNLVESVRWLEQDNNQQRGEFVVIIAGCAEQELESRRQRQALELVELLRCDVSMKKAVAIACQITGARKNQVYEAALRNATPD